MHVKQRNANEKMNFTVIIIIIDVDDDCADIEGRVPFYIGGNAGTSLIISSNPSHFPPCVNEYREEDCVFNTF